MFDLNPNIFAVRNAINQSVERLREAGQIGRSDEASITIRLNGSHAQTVGLTDSRLIRSICKLGDVFFNPGLTSGAFSVEVIQAKSIRDDPDYVLCPRCRRYCGVYCTPANHDNLCDRCCSVLVQAFPDHPSVPKIIATLRSQNATKREQFQRVLQ